MWVFTVLMLMCRSSAISALVRPRAMVSRTSSSRAVSRSIGCTGPFDRSMPAKVASRRWVMLGEISESPRAGGADRLSEELGPGVLEQEPSRAVVGGDGTASFLQSSARSPHAEFSSGPTHHSSIGAKAVGWNRVACFQVTKERVAACGPCELAAGLNGLYRAPLKGR